MKHDHDLHLRVRSVSVEIQISWNLILGDWYSDQSTSGSVSKILFKSRKLLFLRLFSCVLENIFDEGVQMNLIVNQSQTSINNNLSPELFRPCLSWSVWQPVSLLLGSHLKYLSFNSFNGNNFRVIITLYVLYFSYL